MKSGQIFKLSLISVFFVMASFLSITSRAQETPEEEETPQIQKFKRSLVTLVDYPRYFGSISYEPSYVGFKQTYVDSNIDFSMSAYSFISVKGLLGMRISEALTATFAMQYAQFGTDALDADIYTVKASDVSLLNTQMRVEYCTDMKDSTNRLCPAFQLSVDSFPVLEFTTGTQLKIETLTDMMVGLGLRYEFPVNPFITGNAIAMYENGLQSGQSGKTQLTADNKFALGFLGVYKVDDQRSYTGSVTYEGRAYESIYRTSTVTDKWEGTLNQFVFSVGYLHQF